MIQFQNVNKRYKDNEFEITDLNFSVEPGEFVFLIGPSGSGKTTVIKMLIREELPTDGKIYFDDFDITRLTRNSVYRLRRQIGVVFQDYKLIPDKTVYENVAFAMEVAGKKDHDIKETVPYLLDIVGLEHRADAFPSHLSGGEKQRVAIARAVSNNPRVLIADEPTGNLDPAAAWDIVQILSKINNWGTTVIMSTHGSDIVNTLNKRVIQMDSGHVVRDDKTGVYEKLQQEADSESMDEKATPSVKKETIKVNLNKRPANDSGDSKKWMDKLNPFKRNQEVPKDFVEDEEPLMDTIEDSLEEGLEEMIPGSEAELDRIINDAEKVELSEIGIDADIVERLNSIGYETVYDVLNAGPDKMLESQVIGDKDISVIAEAIEDFIKEEEAASPKVSEKDESEEEVQTLAQDKKPNKKSNKKSAKKIKLKLK